MKFCQKMLLSHKLRLEHYHSEHDKEAYTCEPCNRVWSKKEELESHFLIHRCEEGKNIFKIAICFQLSKSQRARKAIIKERRKSI